MKPALNCLPGQVPENHASNSRNRWRASSLGFSLRYLFCVLTAIGWLSSSAHAVGAPPAFIQGNSAVPQTSQTTVAVVYTAAQIAGDLNVVVVGWSDSTAQVQSVTDTLGNTYALAVGPTVQQGTATQSIYYAKNILGASAGQNVVTVTFTSPANYADIRTAEYSGLDPVNPLDTSVAAQGTSSTSSSGSVTTTNGHDMLVAANLVQDLTSGPGAGYTNRMITYPDGDILEDSLVLSTGNYTATAPLSSSCAWIMQLVAFRLASNTPTFIQSNNVTPSTDVASTTVAYRLPQSAGDLNVVAVGWSDAVSQVQSVTDTAGNTYALAVGPTVGVGTQAIYYAKNIAATASNQVTVTLTQPAHCLDVRIAEYGGLDKVNPLDGTGAANGTGTSSTASVTTTSTSDVLVAANLVQTLTTAADPNYAMRELTSPDGDILEDRAVQTAGNYSASATQYSGAWIMQLVAFRPVQSQPPVVDAGPNQTITLPVNTVTLNGSVADDDLPNDTLTISWTKVSGPGTVTFSSPSAAVSQATFSAAGVYVLQLSANDTQYTSTATTTITVNPEPISIVLSPAIGWPNTIGTAQVMTATLTATNTGAPISGASVQFTVTGPNATSGNATSNSSGITTFSYSGAHSGTDTIQASSGGYTSNTATVNWITTPLPAVATGSIFGRFFAAPDPNWGGNFDIPPSATPVFTQEFPNIEFNPPAGTIPGNTSNVGVTTRPITDVTTDTNGNFTGTIIMQGNGLQLGVGSLYSFEAVFTGAIKIAQAGNITFNIFADDAFILGFNGGATHVSGDMYNVPPGGVTPFQNYTVVGAYNYLRNYATYQEVVNFPAPGTYQYELDHTECCDGGSSITMSMAATNGVGTPIGSLSLTPVTPASIATGQVETLTVQARDAAGLPVPNIGVFGVIEGANYQPAIAGVTATTNSNGQATLQYSGTRAGTDSVQAVATINGISTFSNVVYVPWAVPTGTTGCSVFIFTPQGWINSPAIGAVVQGPIPITLASGITLTSGTLKYFPTANPNQVTVLNSNTTGTGPMTLGTIDGSLLANGEYTIQLQATQSTGACQLNETVISVTGQNKPGRKTVTVTDLKVPLAGIPINISRTYDSLNRGAVGDFGNGWNLDTNVQLSVDKLMNVTFSWNGKRQTFYFTPQSNGSALFPWLIIPHYTPQPGLYGTLTSDGCSALIQVGGALVQDTIGVACFPAGTYQPTVYTYTDPSGRAYTISASGQLQSIRDLNRNIITITPTGITSSVNGIVVPFVRDGSGRITKITDLNNNNYTYSYDTNGNLQSVQYPGVTQAETYTYATDHSLLTDTDPVGNTSTSAYYDSTNDGGNSQLDGRLKSVAGPTVADVNGNPVQYTTQYTYNLSTKTTTTTNPDGGTVVETDDGFGKPLSISQQVNSSTTRTTTYQYDAKENLTSMTDACGNGSCPDTTGSNHTWTYTYDANGFQTSVQDPLLHTSHKTYNQFGGLLTSTDAAQTNTSTITYDGNFNPQQVTDLLNGAGTPVSSYTYDTLGDVQSSTDANSKTTEYAYDPNGRLAQVTDPLQEVTYYFYNPMGQRQQITDPRSNATKFTYDALGNLKTKLDAYQNTTSYIYDNNGNKKSETDANTHTTQYQYDALNRLTLITYPDNTTKQFRYDFRGNKLLEIDQSGHTTKYLYDLAGQLTSVTTGYGTSDAGTVSYTYDLDGRKATVTDELNHVTNNTYDVAGNLVSVKDAANNVTSYGYDADNRRTSMTDANNHPTQYAYDARNRLTAITYPLVPPASQATTTKYTYDGMGRVLTTTDQAGLQTANLYDAVGRLTSVTDALSHITHYGYDLSGNLTGVTDAAGRTTSYGYDKLNRRASRMLPLNQTETYTYDAVGNLATKIDFNNLQTTYSYDRLNRLLTKVPDATLSQPTDTFTYTPTGKRATMADASGTTNYSSYDNRDRLKTKATPEGTLSYTYDAHSNVLTLASSNTNGASLTYTYDVLNRLANVTDNRWVAQGGASGLTTYTYDAVGNLANYTDPNAVQTSYTYDTLNRLTQMGSAKTGTTLSNFAYTLGLAGNRTALTESTSRAVNYGYDNVYKLTSEAVTNDPASHNGTVNYTSYDAVGNRLAMTSTLSGVPGGTFSYDTNDRLTTDTYNANGNTVSSAGIANTYDFENHMLTHGAVTMVYDGDGNRVSETIGGTTTKFLVDSLNPTKLPQVMDETVNGSVTRTYAYGLQRISEDQLVSGSWVPSFYGYDGHGNVRFLSNSAGTVTDSYTYDAFGLPITTSGTTPNNYLYSGEQYDSALGAYYLRARYYNPATGRFLAMDPYEGDVSDPLTFHKYVYTANNPVNFVDPSGEADVEENSVIGSYWRLRRLFAGQGMQVHHLIEQRFAVRIGAALLTSACTISVALTKSEHQAYTNAWRNSIPYGPGTNAANLELIWNTAMQIYAGSTQIIGALEECRQELGF
jgi:RHS repeat-associated protein